MVTFLYRLEYSLANDFVIESTRRFHESFRHLQVLYDPSRLCQCQCQSYGYVLKNQNPSSTGLPCTINKDQPTLPLNPHHPTRKSQLHNHLQTSTHANKSHATKPNQRTPTPPLLQPRPDDNISSNLIRTLSVSLQSPFNLTYNRVNILFQHDGLHGYGYRNLLVWFILEVAWIFAPTVLKLRAMGLHSAIARSWRR
jgi:hypothetical protein